ncbi:MAG: fused signal recognition particle receptor [Nitrospirae bacterium]|nr:MAG: fused signal recognition particle receptor [Nitrospirota bacterium]
MGFFDRLKAGLAKTRHNFVARVESVLLNRTIDESVLDDIEEILITSDVGAGATEDIIQILKEKIRSGAIAGSADVTACIQGEMAKLLGHPQPLVIEGIKPYVILMAGVNGVGKTTTIGKLAQRYVDEGKSVVLAAGDTFRAAAVEQLEIWAQRTGAAIIRHQAGSDPAAVAFDAVEAAKSRNADLVIIDTAGRLHNKTQLMDELKKINRVIKKSIPDAPHDILLVVDGTTGQNALRQAQVFNEVVGLTGIVLTKLDGTAKGGIVFAIYKELGIPIKLIGIGEKADDLRDFSANDFVKALFEK